MAVLTDALVPALEDAREAHAAVLDRLRDDAAITPPSPSRQMLERQMNDVQDSLERIDHQVRALRPRSGLVEDTVDMARFISRSAVRTVMLPLAVGSTLLKDVLGGQPHDERRLLRNAEDEYVVTARALATCRAGQSIAEEAHEQAIADLLAALRRQDEELLDRLEDSIADRARAVAAAADGFIQENGGSLAAGAAHTLRTAAHRVQDAAQTCIRQARGAAEDMVRETLEPTQMAEGLRGAVAREEELPIPHFSQLSVEHITQQLRTLPQWDLTVIEEYERTHSNRPPVLDTIEQLRGERSPAAT
ncbi:hypothetical protein [Streptomyces galilaeus]|uniref:hypothetical protein n=1 Tax=Streptomyces galilaeus TaxID=33899 RepID=UPI0016789B25|nr:hypothetical protein [Streptomyces galilaeus]GGW84200.1 hypothetical protein GCM10010350_81170 [Streptomyces galilaeus]